jgi:hypothetical protein
MGKDKKDELLLNILRYFVRRWMRLDASLAETEGFELKKSPLISFQKSSSAATSRYVPLLQPLGRIEGQRCEVSVSDAVPAARRCVG